MHMKIATTTKLLVGLFILVFSFMSQATAQETKIKWFGHAAFSITTPNGKVLLIDPWLKNPSNPEAKDGKDPLGAVAKVDFILLTHGHRDHVGDAVEIANKTRAVLISNPELAANLVKLADFPSKQAQTEAIMGIGGEIQIADGEVTVVMTPANHSSSVFNPKLVLMNRSVPTAEILPASLSQSRTAQQFITRETRRISKTWKQLARPTQLMSRY